MIKTIIIICSSFLSVLFAFLSQKIPVSVPESNNSLINNQYSLFSNFYFTLSFLSLAIPCFLCGEGTDLYIYVQLYENWTLADLKYLNFEAGYIILNVLLHFFIKNAYIGLGIIKVLSLLLVYISLYKLKDRLNLGLSILSYVVLLYIYNFHLLRMSLSIGIVFLALAYELCGKTKTAITLTIVSVLFHYSSVTVLLVLSVYVLFRRRASIAKLSVFLVVLMLVYINIVTIAQNLVSSISAFGKYETYLNKVTPDIGVIQIIMFIPIVYILINCYKYGKTDKFYVLNMLFGIMLFFSGSLGYIIPVAGRMSYYFLWFSVTFFGATSLIDDRYIFKLGKIRVNSITVAAVIYLVLQSVVTFVFTKSFVSNGLTQYTLWWNK